jgi:hypothetical protein
MSIGMCRDRGLAGFPSANQGEDELGQKEKALDRDLESLSVADGGVGGQFCSSGDGGSRCEVPNHEPGSHSGDEACLPALLRGNLAMFGQLQTTSHARSRLLYVEGGVEDAEGEQEGRSGSSGNRHCPKNQIGQCMGSGMTGMTRSSDLVLEGRGEEETNTSFFLVHRRRQAAGLRIGEKRNTADKMQDEK